MKPLPKVTYKLPEFATTTQASSTLGINHHPLIDDHLIPSLLGIFKARIYSQIRTTATPHATAYQLASTTRIDDGNWHHIFGSWFKGELFLCVDGELEDYLDVGYSYFGSGAVEQLYVGGTASGSGGFFNGSMDDLRIYNGSTGTQATAQGLYFHDSGKDPEAQGELWRIEIDATGSVTSATRLHPDFADFSDLELNSSDPSQGWVIRKSHPGGWPYGGRELQQFSNWGATLTASTAAIGDSTCFRRVYVNPADSQHVVLYCGGVYSSNIRYSLDGGLTWLAENRAVGAHIPSMQGWTPSDHDTYGLGLNADSAHEWKSKMLSFLPGNPNELIWINFMNGGLMKSTDYGANFTTYAAGGVNKEAGQIAVSSANPDHWSVGMKEYGVVVTDNGGLSWRGISHENDTLIHDLGEIAKNNGGGWGDSHNMSGSAYNPLDANHMLGSFSVEDNLLESHDSGGTWIDTGIKQPVAGQNVLAHWSENDPDRVYVGRLRSNDAGATWADIGKYVIGQSASNPDLLVGIDQMVSDVDAASLLLNVSIDGGTTWASLPEPAKEAVPGLSEVQWQVSSTRRSYSLSPVKLLSIDPSPSYDPTLNSANRLRILMAGRSGIYEYNAPNADGSGATVDWQLRNVGLEPNDHFSAIEPVPWMGFVAFDPRPGFEHVVYASKSTDRQQLDLWDEEDNGNHTYSGGDNYEPYYRSEDGGLTWSKLHGANHTNAPSAAMMVSSMEVGMDGRLFISTSAGLYIYTHNKAPTWAEASFTAPDATEGQAYSKNNNWRVTDPEGDALSYTMLSGPAWASINSNGKVTGVPAWSDVGLNTFVLSASDGANLPVEVTMYINVLPDWQEVLNDDFESGLGNWTDGGNDCKYHTGVYAVSGNASVNLEDNTDSSTMTTGDLTVAGRTELKVVFDYQCVSMDTSEEDFWLQISTDGGASYVTAEEWNLDDEFVNDVIYTGETVLLDGLSLTDQTRIRFRCDANGGGDDVYIDNVVISVK